MITSTISNKGQITVPKEIRNFLQARSSDKIVFIPQEDGNVLIKVVEKSASTLFGMLKHRKLERPVALKDMESDIRERRARRGTR